MKAKNHQISNNNKNIVYVINNTSIKRKSKSKKIRASKTMNYSLPPEQAYRSPDNRFLNSSNLNTEMQRTQLDLMNPKLRGRESEIEQRIFNIQNSIKEENETLKKMNNLYSRFDSTPRFEDSINNIYGLNEYDNQGTFEGTQGSDHFINEGMDRDQYISPSEISSISGSSSKSNVFSNVSSTSDIFNNLISDSPLSEIHPNRLFTPSTINEPNNSYRSSDSDRVMTISELKPLSLASRPPYSDEPTNSYISSDSDTVMTNASELNSPIRPFTLASRTPQTVSSSLINAFKSMKLENTPQERPFTLAPRAPPQTVPPSLINAFKSMKLQDTPQERPFTASNTSMNISETPFKAPTERPFSRTIQNSPMNITETPFNVPEEIEANESIGIASMNPRQEIPNRLSNVEVRNMLKNEYRALGGDNPIIFNTTKKKTLDGEIKRLKTIRDLREAYRLNGGTDPMLLEAKMVNINQLRKAITEQQKEMKKQQRKESKHQQKKGKKT
jgi:hypothetical protein